MAGNPRVQSSPSGNKKDHRKRGEKPVLRETETDVRWNMRRSIELDIPFASFLFSPALTCYVHTVPVSLSRYKHKYSTSPNSEACFLNTFSSNSVPARFRSERLQTYCMHLMKRSSKKSKHALGSRDFFSRFAWVAGNGQNEREKKRSPP